METLNDLPILLCETVTQWEAWLRDNHTQTQGIWLQKFAKKAAEVASVSYDDALDVALCYGWIDGLVKTYDASFYLQRFTPRRRRSVWSKRNVAKVAELAEAGRMRPPGLAAVEAAKKDGRWEQAYESPKDMTVPPDFQSALDANPQAGAFFATLSRTNVYAVLWRIHTARTPSIRQASIEKLVTMLGDGKTLHPQANT